MASANALATIALALFLPAIYLLMQSLGPRRGVLAALLGGWMFLPVFDGRLNLPFLSSKLTFVAGTILLASLAFDSQRWLRLRLHWVDLAAAALCAGPFATALVNGLGAYEGASAAVQSFFAWTAPYLLGRVYFGEPREMRELAVWLVGGALLYLPLCLWEIRMSPQLHRQLYGFHTVSSFAYVVRYGGYRPAVFMQFGLMVGTFMATGALVAYWLWRTRAVTRFAGLPAGWCTAALAVTTLLVKSTGAIILLAGGIAILEGTRRLRHPVLMLTVTLLPVAFVAARITGWAGAEVISGAAHIQPERAESLAFRVLNEQMLVEKAMERPGLGWGRFGRSRVFDDDGRDVSVTDSLWVILLGMNGLVGLVSVAVLLLAPVLLLLGLVPARHWDHPAFAPVAAVSLGTVLFAVDCLFNAMTSPVFLAMSGATLTFHQAVQAARRRGAPAVAPRSTGTPPAVQTGA
ncbi:conserved hypothetical protein [Anaeromyxobacter sp. K]|uniref:hypothetical protein n=1 Tax=Anaeromyxobacter sp. (strain K) TaxID=447217 RepID=UPI00015F8597|nr:hypothetical protein [Anaeromyxobacter sp. K]ACG74100.1 conserved hypothetical protein [Anaeromyxobacter sp. K]